MNDRFRFRAKRLDNNEFVYGYLCFIYIDKEKHCRIYSPYYVTSYDCYTKTLEQCTGLKDKNGNLIYEGDIVRIFYDHFNGTFTEKEVVGPVKWECGAWVVNNSLLNHAPEYDETHLESAAVEVIGNIHENKELLEVEK